jgi:UDP-N-acetylglucosamine 2-epimerase (non-hydrolysing)
VIKVMAVFGTRPEAIKVAPVVMALRQHPDEFETQVCVTAQHREMLDQVLTHFGLTPDYDLNIMQPRQSLAQILTRALAGLEQVLAEAKPDIVLVHGDTATTFAGSLAAFYAHTQIGHIEAGLRSFDKWFPYPEEVYRRLTGVIADVNLAPTSVSRGNLLREGARPESIYVTGNSVIDALLWTVSRDYRFADPRLTALTTSGRKLIVVECHRRENFGQPMRDIAGALRDIVTSLPDVELVVSAHLNPEAGAVQRAALEGLDRVHIFDPFTYPEWSNLMAHARLIISDSGGLQEEAPALGVPVLVCRDVTERPEAVAAGTVKLVGTDRARIVAEATALVSDAAAHAAMAHAANPYGDGKTSERIVEALRCHFGLRSDRPVDWPV